jgi:putative flippase GtrA
MMIKLIIDLVHRGTCSQAIRYVISGSLNVSLELLLFVIFHYLFKIQPLSANLFAIMIGISSGFIIHHVFTFKNKYHSINQVLRYIVVISIGAILNQAILMMLLQIIDISLIAKIIQIGLLSIYNYNLYNRFVYRNG